MSKCQQCIIREFSTLRSLSADELKTMSEEKDILTFKKGDVIFEEGNTLNGVYCVKHGICKLSKLNANGKEQIVRFIKGGDMLGYRSVLSEEPVTLTVTALKDMEACYIPKKEILDAIKENPKFSLDMMRTVCHDLRDANILLSNMAQKNVKERLADTLIFLKETFGEDKDGYLDIVLTREEISSVIGTATESAIRLLSEFKKKGFIALDGKKVKVLDEVGLLKLSQGF
ncbi:Crp/Fnr family transcriptional regulator [Aureibaculum sp. 2210JD6-5]|uniref:Crp/Fnr family transcriptional regulator n=1 Tax=Aureibaculum sp. 2210JD6-5 TaxID=3103957 RepID=UPI002AAD3C86|nr:Crp/Fnr family transcriptional regulator [Aureibaculum sp. 2210JD6-5]MDY7396661.1 Crp/Fnr family transcriptional regulator [Aureibaculum sp. 2210JD6-5]